MNYRSIANLSHTIRANLHKLPEDIDLIVGIPRSGMLVANIIALNLNLKFCELNHFINDIPLQHGQQRRSRYANLLKPSDARHVLIVDDSISSGESINTVRAKIEMMHFKPKLTYCSIYVTPNMTTRTDIYLEIVKHPRFFEWNLMHRESLSECCVDLDGILCVDPTEAQNNDGPAYLKFLANATPLVLPSYPIGHIVTSRLEKYRKETEQWLAAHGVIYNKLHMLDLPDAETRRRLNCHASFKAEVFKNQNDTGLFIESEPQQAMQIAKIAGKHALSFSTQELFAPHISYAILEYQSRHFARRAAGKIHRLAKRLLIRG
jgi:uncharacterized HAD superfamily protein/hypoxanthine phosphoribosyltransferase